MPHGYNGKILHVNLTSGDLAIEEPEEAFYRKYLGGSAMGLYYLFKEMPAGVDSLGPDNILALCLSVLTGAPFSGQSRMTAVAKSPSSGGIGDSQCGGFFPAEMKFAGFDGIIIRGRATQPVYLWVDEGQAELRDAGHLWGRITGEVEETLKAELGDKRLEVLQIGPAGENQVRFAAIMNMSNRANGRTGMGAVMGSKNLKAVVVRGTQKPSLADKAGLNELARWGALHFPESDVAGLGKYGTANVMATQQVTGGLPTYNFNSSGFDQWDAISGTTMYDTILRGADQDKQDRYGRETCYSCTVRCKRVVEIKEGPFQAGPQYGGPEFETTATFGSYCGVGNLAAIATCNQLCNQYGMDTISCGATIAWAMECFEEGRLTLKDTGGIELRYGDAEAMVKLTEMIAKREGFGNILAEGSAHAAAIIGRGTDEFLITTKNQETPAHMPHVKPSLSVIYAVNPFGSDHQSSQHDSSYKAYPERMAQLGLTSPQPKGALNAEMVRYAMITQRLYSVLDSINICQFVFGPGWQLYGPDHLVQATQAVTGWDVTLDELMQVGERRLNLLRAFNVREGIGREADTLPKKFFNHPLQGGKSEGQTLDYDRWREAIDTYYEMCGWDVQTGYPTREKLESLGLDWVAEMLAG